MASKLLAFLRRHPIATGIIACAMMMLAVNVVGEWRREAFLASPEGQRQLAREQEKFEQELALDMAERLVKLQLRDPESAVFSGMRLVVVNGKKAVCGLVNSRNGFGGMSGPTLFVHLRDDPITGSYILGAQANAAEMIEKYCSR